MKISFCLLFSLVVVLSASPTFAQTTEKDSTEFDLGKEISKVFNTKVIMDVDTSVFNARQGNFYMNEESKAMIMTMVVPQSLKRVEEDFDKKSKKKEVKVLETKKFTHDGKNFLYQKAVVKKDGNKAFMYVYAIEATPESSIFITCTHMDGDEKKFFPAIERAALSARLAQK
jgi:hypothetical protein